MPGYWSPNKNKTNPARVTMTRSSSTVGPPGRNYVRPTGPTNIRDEKVEQERNEGDFLQSNIPGNPNVTYQQLNEDRAAAALKLAQDRSAEIVRQQALGKRMERSGIDSLSDKQIDSMRDLFAMEAAGMDVTEYEAQVNRLKKIASGTNLNNTIASEKQRKAAYDALDRLNAHLGGGDPKKTQAVTDYQLEKLGYDDTGMRSWNDIESDNTAKFAYYGLQNPETPLDQIKSMLPQIGYDDYSGSTTSGGPGPHYGGYGGRSGRGYGGYQGPPLPGIMQGDPQGENRYASLGMNEFMVNVHSPMYTNRNRGGIMNRQNHMNGW